MNPSRDHGTDGDPCSPALLGTRGLAHTVGNQLRSARMIPHTQTQDRCEIASRERADGYHIRDTCSDPGLGFFFTAWIRRGR